MERMTLDKIARKYGHDVLSLRKLVVNSFVRANHLKVTEGLLMTYLQDVGTSLDEDIPCKEFTIEDAIHIFEVAVSEQEKKARGVVYTPRFVRDNIVSHSLDIVKRDIKECLCADISCGCGAFLYTLIVEMRKRTRLSCRDIIRHLYGADIDKQAIENAKILMALTALQYGEIALEIDFNLFCADSLSYDFKKTLGVFNNKGFDIIVGNPPYSTSKHWSEETWLALSHLRTVMTGKKDLYIPFLEVANSALCDNGILGFITPNGFFKSANARGLRKLFADERLSISILDFGCQQVFRGVSTYTCLLFLSKTSSACVRYAKAEIEDVICKKQLRFNEIGYERLDNIKGWNLVSADAQDNIAIIESVGRRLGDAFSIKSDIATLANDIFIFKPEKEDKKYYYHTKDGVGYIIEKGICRDIVKPNILKCEDDIQRCMHKIIFPYDKECNIMDEMVFSHNFPQAYRYLSFFRKRLDGRDKGRKTYPKWYAFGRTQGMRNVGKKLLFPYMTDKPHFVYSAQENLLYNDGYAIYGDSERELLVLKKILESSVFEYYIKETSKPYSSGYYSYSKAYVENFGIYPLREDEKRCLLECDTQESVNAFLEKLYNVEL